MRKIISPLRALCALTLAFAATVSLAEVQPIPMPADTKLVTFTFDQNNTYTILTRPRAVTDLALHPEEEVVAMALGDSAQWIVTDAPGHIFIKPLHPGIVTSGTLVTSKRTYQISLRSSPEDGKYYQRVSWEYPDLIVLRRQQAVQVKAAVDLQRSKHEATIVSPDVKIENINFNYRIDGEADWKPQQVFDDGKFTWIRLGQTQDIPVVFALSEDDKAELINTNIRGEYLVAQRILPRMLLKLGERQVKITNRKLAPSGFFSFGG